MPLLYQSGYITIKGYDPETELYTLDIPNKEIRVGLYRSLLPNYIGMNTVKGTTTIAKMSAFIRLIWPRFRIATMLTLRDIISR